MAVNTVYTVNTVQYIQYIQYITVYTVRFSWIYIQYMIYSIYSACSIWWYIGWSISPLVHRSFTSMKVISLQIFRQIENEFIRLGCIKSYFFSFNEGHATYGDWPCFPSSHIHVSLYTLHQDEVPWGKGTVLLAS